jgi:hypothetical protein
MKIAYVLLATFLWKASLGNPDSRVQKHDPGNDVRAYLVEKKWADSESSLKLFPVTKDHPGVIIVQVDGKAGEEKFRCIITMVQVANTFLIRESSRLHGGATYRDVTQAKESILIHLQTEYSKHLKLFPSTLKKAITADEVLLTEVLKIDDQNFKVVCVTDQRPLSGTLSIAKLVRNRDGSFYVADLLTSKK